ncbi:MAG: Cytochrome C biogenesis protein transmembrane region [Candidatus Saccharibacteria bacterium GW2011_GWC2_48_9]|nr:MAG: Cytochrome C biogenesis protein transmembrane region [Candidatus Saccharibacteria bacterium GW2011_GWC2_48_9]HCH34711.1 cytochrome C biogenesis protein [Candidatus Saccharibacteria bacterium]
MFLLLGAFFAGMITVFAPCIFALLPVIVGGSISGNVEDKRRPLIITASLAVSLIVFTVLLKATTLFIDISPEVITYISGGIIVGVGILTLFPQIYERIILFFNLQAKSQQLLGKGSRKGAAIGAIITGAALGPVFSSCSPVYAYLIATVLPVNFGLAMLYIVAYVIGLSIMLLLIGFIGQKLVRKMRFAANPRGWFQRTIAILFIVVGLLIITGYDKQFQTFISQNTPFDFDGLSAKLIPATSDRESKSGVLNVEPYAAPELTGLQDWINSDPQTIEELEGKVVLIDFWTYSCINCIRTQPYLKSWYETYKDSGFEIIGVHAPEFAFERSKENVENATEKAGLKYPIALDNNFSTWAAYENQYWPATYLIDAEGQVRRYHAGEGQYKETEQAIRQLLEEKGSTVPDEMSDVDNDGMSAREGQTPETYLGTRRASDYQGMQPLVSGEHVFTQAALPAVNDWTLDGKWKVNGEGVTAVGDASLTIRVAAKDLYLVTGSDAKGKIGVSVNGKSISSKDSGSDVDDSQVDVSMAQLYEVVSFDKFTNDSTIRLNVPDGVQLNAFTFGG